MQKRSIHHHVTYGPWIQKNQPTHKQVSEMHIVLASFFLLFFAIVVVVFVVVVVCALLRTLPFPCPSCSSWRRLVCSPRTPPRVFSPFCSLSLLCGPKKRPLVTPLLRALLPSPPRPFHRPLLLPAHTRTYAHANSQFTIHTYTLQWPPPSCPCPFYPAKPLFSCSGFPSPGPSPAACARSRRGPVT